MKFETLQKSKALNSMMTKFFVILDTCQYWHLSSFRPQFWTKNGNFPILIKFCTLHKPRVVNSMVTMVFCDSWHLSILIIVNIGNLSFRPQFSTKYSKCSSFDEILYFTQRVWWIQWFWYWQMQVSAAEN